MTTIIIIVVVALVFFAAVSLSVFIVWKRETEMRTNSIRFIEDNLIEIRKELANTGVLYGQNAYEKHERSERESGRQCADGAENAEDSKGKEEKRNNQIHDTESYNIYNEQFADDVGSDNKGVCAEINLDFAGAYDDYEWGKENEPPVPNVGKSGKKYTISELETLIKE